MKKPSVRIRLTLWYTLVLALAMATLTAVLYAAMRNALERDLDNDLHNNTASLAERILHEFDEGEEPQHACQSVVRKSLFHNLWLEVYAPNGERIAASDALVDHPLASAVDRGAVPRLGDEPMLRVRLEDRALDDSGVEVAAIAVEHPHEGKLYMLVVGSGRTHIETTLAVLRRLAFTIVPLLLALAVLGGWALASRALAPVATMADQARRMGADRLTDRLEVPNPDDELGRLAATFNELLDRIESAFDRMRQFVADASHELRTPVGVIRGGTAVALTPPVTVEECVETLHVIEDQTVRLGRLVEDMFTLARADAGDPSFLATEAVPVEELVVSCAAAAQKLAAEDGIVVDVEPLPEEEKFCRGDRGRLEQMLMNLLTNAVRHSGHNGRVSVGVRFTNGASRESRETREMAAIWVCDTGPGIPEHLREVVFDRFVRLDSARSRSTGGSGLGLAISRWVVEAHGGTIEIGESKSGGARFTVFLPLNHAPTKQTKGTPTAPKSYVS